MNEIRVYTVWDNHSTGVNEQCLKTANGDFVGIETGNLYSKDKYYSSPQFIAKIISVDDENNTGMYHLYSECWDDENHEDNRAIWKKKYIGCVVTVEESHWAYNLKIYRCLELDEYFSSNEIEIISE